VNQGKTLFIADTNITELPDAMDLADIAESTAHFAREFGFEPRVAFLSYSTFGNPVGERMQKVRDAVQILDNRDVDFEYEGNEIIGYCWRRDCFGTISDRSRKARSNLFSRSCSL